MTRPFLIDITRLFYHRLKGRIATGIDRVTQEYARHYSARARAVLTAGPFSSILPAADTELAFRYVTDPAAGGLARGLWLIAKAVLAWRPDPDVTGCILIKTGHPGHETPDYNRRFTRRGARLVTIAYDLIPATHPEYCRPGERERHLARTSNAIATSAGLIAISQDTLEAFEGHAREAGLTMPPAIAAPLASGLPDVAPGPRPIEEPYFIAIGTIEARKNHILLLHLWRELAGDPSFPIPHPPGRSGAMPRLVIVGQRGWECENVVDLLERCPALRGNVIELNRCSDAELVTYLRHAQALLFPTFAEGYGMPIAEALALGTPVIASDLPVFREVAGDLPEYVDPLDGRRWMELIVDYAQPASGRRAAQLERIKGFRATTWKQHFERVDAFVASFIQREA